MAIHSSTGSQIFERHKWASDDAAVQAWVNDIVWTILTLPDPAAAAVEVATPSAKNAPKEAVEVLREVIREHHLEGRALYLYGDKLLGVLGKQFYEEVEKIESRTDLYLQEVHWLLGPKLGAQTLLIDDFAMRKQYASSLSPKANPRYIYSLTLWTPTLATRDDVITLLRDGGFSEENKVTGAYSFVKQTHGLPHNIRLRGILWDASKNWALDVEREIFDRAVHKSVSIPLNLDVTDLLLLACRKFSIDSVCGSAIGLLDLVTLLARNGEDIDWDRLRHIKNSFHKPDWLWAAMVAIAAYEHKTGRTFVLADWVRKGLKDTDSFWSEFITSRMNWANPDTRLVDFTRAYVKAAKGT